MAAHTGGGHGRIAAEVQGGESSLEITVLEARNLPAADISGTSDPYVFLKDTKGIHIPGKGLRTVIIKRTLTPTWNHTFPPLVFNYKLAALKFKVYDHDTFTSDDLMCTLKIPTEYFLDGESKDAWWPMKNKIKGSAARPEIHIAIRAKVCIRLVSPGAYIPITSELVSIGLGWDSSKKIQIDLDASVVALDAAGQILTKVWYRELIGFGGAIRHTGDNRTGEGDGDDEEIDFNLAQIPPACVAMVVLIDSFTKVPLNKIKSAYMRVFERVHGQTLGFYRLSNLTPKHGLFFGCFYRDLATQRFYFRTAAMPCEAGAAAIPDLMRYLKSEQLI